MSIFRPYKFKEKPDLLPDAPVKHGFFVFWEIFIRKFWRFVTINLMYFVITLPMLIWVYLIINGYFSVYVFPEVDEFIDILPGVSVFAALIIYIPSFLHIPLLALSVFLYGPATMGISYIFRNFAREEHAWVSDLFSRALSNFKQGLFFGILDVLVVYLLLSGIFNEVIGGEGLIPILSVILRALCIVVFFVYMFMRHYFYTMAVTVNLSVIKIIKNAMLFVVIGFGRNLLSLIVCLIAAIITFFTIPFLSIILTPVIFYSFSGFAAVFICYPVIKKYIIVPALERESKAEKPQSGAEEV